MESTMASRSCSNFSFCLRVNGFSLRSRWFLPSNLLGDCEIFDRAVTRTAFFEVDLLAKVLRAGFALRAAVFFLEIFFFFDLAIIQKAPSSGAGKNRSEEHTSELQS